jgi:hypothetical protein
MKTLLATAFPDDKDDPLLRWNHPNHAAGFLADLAVLLYEREDPETLTASSEWNGTRMISIPSNHYYKAAKAVISATRRVWSASARRMFAAHWGTIVHNPHSLVKHDYHATAYAELVTRAARILVGHLSTDLLDPCIVNSRVKHLCLATAWTTIDQDDVRRTEIKWRIRDWLALTDDVVDIPLRYRRAAITAWRGGARQTAFQIIVAGTATMAAKHRD